MYNQRWAKLMSDQTSTLISFDESNIITISFYQSFVIIIIFHQTRSYPLYQYQLWSSLTSEPPHQSQRIFTLCWKCCFNKAKQTLHVCQDWKWCKAMSTFLQAFLFSKWTVFCRMIASVHGTTRQTFCGYEKATNTVKSSQKK